MIIAERDALEEEIAWSFWISGTFGFYAPLPLLVHGPIMLGFYLWLARHFRDNLRMSS